MRPAELGKLRRRTGGRLGLDRPVEQQREAFRALLELTEIGMPEHACSSVDYGGVDCLRVTPSELHTDRPVVYVHGGGYSLGSPESHRPLAARIARRLGAELILPRYRLAPEHPCPAALDDVLAVWTCLHAGGASSQRWILAGDSAGGGLALAAAMCLRDAGSPLPTGLVLLSPWSDLTMSGASIDALAQHEVMLRRPGLELMAGRYAGALSREDPGVSPAFGKFEGLPPMLIQVGGHEVLLDDALDVAGKAERAGVAVELQIYPGQVHVFQATPMLEAAATATQALADWARAIHSPGQGETDQKSLPAL
jgi:monoterpene epsilon-lactone hydrolase